MTPAILFLILIGPFFGVLCAWVWAVWPQNDPTDDALYERRHQAHRP